jgi:putative addiction module CopG family antidote
MIAMGLTLDPELEKLIEEKVRSGRYATPQDVVRAGLASLEQQESIAAMSTEEFEAIFPGFRRKIAEGVADEQAGRMSDGEEFFDQLEREDRE